MVILRTRNKITDFFMILAWASPFNKSIATCCQASSLFFKVLPMFTNFACLTQKKSKPKDVFFLVEHNIDCVGVS